MMSGPFSKVPLHFQSLLPRMWLHHHTALARMRRSTFSSSWTHLEQNKGRCNLLQLRTSVQRVDTAGKAPVCPAMCTGTVRWAGGWPVFDALTCSVSLLLLPKGYSRQPGIRWTWIRGPDEDKQGEVLMKPSLNTGCRLSGTCPELRCLPGPNGVRPSWYTWADAAVGWSWSVWHSHTLGCQPGPVRVNHKGWDVPHLMFPLHQGRPSNVTPSKALM